MDKYNASINLSIFSNNNLILNNNLGSYNSLNFITNFKGHRAFNSLDMVFIEWFLLNG